MIWEFADVIGRRLVALGVLAATLGAVAIGAGGASWRGVGVALVAAGVLDGGLGALVRVLAERARRGSIGDQAARDRAARLARPILLLAASLAAAVVILGTALPIAGGDDWRSGLGAGIAVHGAVVLVFAVAHARWVPSPMPLLADEVATIAGPGHEGFRLSRVDPDAAAPAGPERGALLVHGFAGSPRDLRWLAAVLAAAGWVVEAPCLPGHGPTFRDVAEYRVADWLAAVEDSAADLRAGGATALLVVGHAEGAALALATSARTRPDAMVLLAPSGRRLPPWQRLAWSLARVVMRPDVGLGGRAGVAGPMRDLRVPVSLVEQLLRLSALGAAAAADVRVPVLEIQGTTDSASPPDRARGLLARLPTPATYLELDAGHDLVSEASPVRDRVLALVLAFARDIAGGRTPPA